MIKLNFIVMNIPVILTVTFLWIRTVAHPSQLFMFNCFFFFIATFVVEHLPLQLNAWLFYKRSAVIAIDE